MKDFHLEEHRNEIERLITYIPWLESKAGKTASQNYSGGDISATTIAFPVYEGTLMSFVNEASSMSIIDPNYVYVYGNLGIRTIEDEKKAVSEATVTEAGILQAVLSKYVLTGMTKGVVWNTAVKEGIFLEVLKRFKELCAIWDKPLA